MPINYQGGGSQFPPGQIVNPQDYQDQSASAQGWYSDPSGTAMPWNSQMAASFGMAGQGGGSPPPRSGGPQVGAPGGPRGGGSDQMSRLEQVQQRYEASIGYSPMGGLRDAQADLDRAMAMGADPMTMSRLQRALQNAQQQVQEYYARKMMEMNQPQPHQGGSIGSGGRSGGFGQPQRSQMQQDPYLAMMLQAQLGMGGGGGRGAW